MSDVTSHVVRFDAVPGIVPVLLDELAPARVIESTEAHVVVELDSLASALHVRTAFAAYLVRTYAVARPKALLGDATLRAVLAQIADVRALGPFASLRIGAAGSDSAVFQRFVAELSKATGLPHDPDDGDLLVRVVRAGDGWSVLVRLTPRPLSTRAWRVPGFEGAIDASVAAAMVRLTRPRADDVFLDPMCGSATIAVERLAAGPAAAVFGSDVDAAALAAASANGASSLVRADARHLPLPDGSVSALCVNPPWGHQMGSHEENERLHPALLHEAGRVACRGARFVVLTHELRRFERALREQRRWRVEQKLQVSLRGHHPGLWVLADSN